MFKRKLSALEYTKDFDPTGKYIQIWMHLNLFHIKDEDQFRQMVVWLEDMKIRLYPIDGRQHLKDFANSQWEVALKKVTVKI